MLALGLLLTEKVLLHAGKNVTIPLLAVWLGLSVAVLVSGIKR